MRIACSFLIAALLCSCQGPSTGEQEEDDLVSSTGCGVERWSIKTGTDSQAAQVSLDPTLTTIAQLQAFAGVASPPLNSRVAPAELTAWKLTDVTLVEFKQESDSDLHLVLSSGGLMMIAEIPAPGCVGAGSPFAAGVAQARQQFTARYTPSGSFTSAGVPVTLSGVGFFDFAHGQTGAAPNQIELHPVLAICFGAGCDPVAVDGGPAPDAGQSDAGAPHDGGSAPDSGTDAGAADGGTASDAGAPDSGTASDAGSAGAPDAGGAAAPPPDHVPTRGCNSTGAAALPLALLAALFARRRKR